MIESKNSIPSFGEAFRFWLKLGFINFGGPAGQIAIMHRELVERRKWMSEPRFLHALNYCMLLPGPEAQQLATYIGLILHGFWGGLIAGAFFVLPSIFILLGLSYVYATWGNIPVILSVLDGFKPVVLAIVIEALVRIGRRSLRTRFLVGLGGAAFVAIYFLKVPFPIIVLGGGLIGFLIERVSSRELAGRILAVRAPEDAMTEAFPPAGWGRAVKVITMGGLLWSLGFGAVWLLAGASSVHISMAKFFTRAAFVTFGGAYAVLAYVGQAAVTEYHWLLPHEMVDGLALAETTPGPLIMVLQFVGFLGGWRLHGGLSPLASGTLAALLTTYFTFLPSFVFVFLGAPYIESWRSKTYLNAALTTITASVVGVIANLGVFMGSRVLFHDGRPDLIGAAMMLVSFVALKRFKVSVVWAITGGGLAGLARSLLGV